MMTSLDGGIAVMTSGGDSPGMNPAVRAIVRTSIVRNFNCFAVFEGYNGLLENKIKKMNFNDVSGIMKKGGTFIETARCLDFQNIKEKRQLAVFNLISLGIDKLVCIGGDGSLTGASTLYNEWDGHVEDLFKDKKITEEQSKFKLKIVGLVGSIDNDFYGSSMMMGVDTALHRIMYAIDSITTTASSHRRAFVIEGKFQSFHS
jgi:6-phosphofructokinase 1